MSKGELIESIAKSQELSKAKATEIVNAVLDAITASLKKGNDVSFVGFGTFSVAKRKARKGRNPLTGEAIKIKAAKLPKFKAGKGLKDAVAGKKK